MGQCIFLGIFSSQELGHVDLRILELGVQGGFAWAFSVDFHFHVDISK